MKCYTILIFVISLKLFSQNIQKDTLYFHFDKHYTLDSSNFIDLSYSEKNTISNISLKQTKTNGYVYFFKEEVFTNLKPKQILSIKDYIETKEFYFNGKFNKIVDKEKVKDLLNDRYIVFLVKDKKFIKLKLLLYSPYYPRWKNNVLIDSRIKDTLVFNLSSNFLKKNKSIFAIINDVVFNSSEDGVSFEIIKKEKHLNVKKILNLEKHIKSSKYYKEGVIDKLGLVYYLSNYIIYIKHNNCFYNVIPFYFVI